MSSSMTIDTDLRVHLAVVITTIDYKYTATKMMKPAGPKLNPGSQSWEDRHRPKIYLLTSTHVCSLMYTCSPQEQVNYVMEILKTLE